MCLILLAYKIHPEYPVILASNRDEFYQRPTKAAHFWNDYPNILAGRDLEKLGTWMGVTRAGRFVALTNYRDFGEEMDGKLSRGKLVTEALLYKGNLLEFISNLKEQDHLYPGYNLLMGNGNQIYYYSNRQGKIMEVTPGIHGLSNAFFNTPWPKVKRGKEELQKILNAGEPLVESIFALLRKSEPFPEEILPKTGIPMEWEKKLSPLFIETPDYGTRASTILLIGKGKILFIERTFDPKMRKMKEKKFTFSIEEEKQLT